ncbi:hypothetical protein TNCV_2072181, partial [Trichonephila clavipes]
MDTSPNIPNMRIFRSGLDPGTVLGMRFRSTGDQDVLSQPPQTFQ